MVDTHSRQVNRLIRSFAVVLNIMMKRKEDNIQETGQK